MMHLPMSAPKLLTLTQEDIQNATQSQLFYTGELDTSNQFNPKLNIQVVRINGVPYMLTKVNKESCMADQPT